MSASTIMVKAAAELVPELTENNSHLDEETIGALAEDLLVGLTDRLCRAYYDFGRPPTDEERVELVCMFTQHGIKRDTAEMLYNEVLDIEKPRLPSKKSLQ